jgi:hypothetical protein
MVNMGNDGKIADMGKGYVGRITHAHALESRVKTVKRRAIMLSIVELAVVWHCVVTPMNTIIN